MPYKDPEKKKAYMKEYYARYYPEHKGEYHARTNKWREGNRQKVRDGQNQKWAEDEEYRQRRYAQSRTSKLAHMDKTNARDAVKRAVKRGVLVVPESCPFCGGTENRIEAHHEDYTKPLDIVWLCSLCHGKLSRKSV